MSGKTIQTVKDGVIIYDVFDELESLRKQVAEKCNCHHWVCGCNFTVGHNSECKAGC
jgi:hypothetical protein